MSKQTIVRLLAGLTFLIFLCPFFQTCSDKNLLKRTVEKGITVTPEELRIEQEKSLIESRKGNTASGYEMAFYIFNKFELQDLSDSGFYYFLCFFIVLIISIILFYFSFKNKFRIIYLLSLINLVLVIFPMLSFYFAEILEDLNQIKYGYYLFIINTIILLLLSRKIMKKDFLPSTVKS
ncbi:hypothetical protein [Flavobacterium cerinum]|uniref:DUF4293 family protein n=1 Tax=Flavobacterium cerinum TaxID=2502784 RepID=A0A444HCN2_9FLAO|nr:hypothetical protein [Flavobacterium cerinum]RWX01501.1 hypothetical protein EPI11_05990 [Flavobacterium cerinum]